MSYEEFEDDSFTIAELVMDMHFLVDECMENKYKIYTNIGVSYFKLGKINQSIQAFKNSLLDTYTSTLAQWGDQEIVTVFPE